VFVAPDVTIAQDAVATAGSVVISNLPAGMVCSGNPCYPLKARWNEIPGSRMALELKGEA
jgi:putative colanic acid biosynthesis acetyltransferase WcaF